MLKLDIINEKGNVKAEIRNAAREQTIQYVVDNTGFINGPNCLYKQIAETLDGEPIYATIDISISLTDPTIKKNKTIKEKEPIEIGRIF